MTWILIPNSLVIATDNKKQINTLDHIVTDNTKTNKNQHNEVTKNEQKFDNTFGLSKNTKDALPVVTVSLRGGKKQRAMTVAR